MDSVSVLGAPLVLLLAGVLLVRAQGRWLAPGPLFTLYWATALLLPPLVAPRFTWSAGAVWYCVALVLAYGVGSFAASHRGPAVRTPGVEARPLRPSVVRAVVVAGTLSGAVATTLVQAANGFPVGLTVSLDDLLRTANSISVARYADSLVLPSVVPLLLAVTYAAALLAPFAARGAPWPVGTLLCAGPVLSAGYFAVITTARAGMLLAVFLLVSGWIGSRLHTDGRTPALGIRTVLVAGLGLAATIVSFLAIALLRAGSTAPEYVAYVRDTFVTYLFGYLPAFSYWFDHGHPALLPEAWGSASLAGIAKHVGGDPAYGMALTDWAPLGTGDSTNIYSAWRHLIQDSGTVLAPLAAAVIGFLATLAWRRSIERPNTWWTVGCMAGYAYALHSVTFPIFMFTNVVVAFLVAAVTLSVASRAPSTPAAGGPPSRSSRGERRELMPSLTRDPSPVPRS